MEHNEIVINNRDELNAVVTKLRAHSIEMCNATDMDTVVKDFLEAKNYLIALYTYNANRVLNNDNNK